MSEEIVAKVILDITAAIEDGEAREPSRYAHHQGGGDHQEGNAFKAPVITVLNGVDCHPAQARDERQQRCREDRAENAEAVAMPVTANVGPEPFHAQRLRYQVKGIKKPSDR